MKKGRAFPESGGVRPFGYVRWRLRLHLMDVNKLPPIEEGVTSHLMQPWGLGEEI